MAVGFEISCGFVNNMGLVDGENSRVLQKFASKVEESALRLVQGGERSRTTKLNCTGMKLLVWGERKLK